MVLLSTAQRWNIDALTCEMLPIARPSLLAATVQ
jgi:hypothetical protein